MAEIRKLLWWRHLRAEATSHVLQYRAGALRRTGRGLAFWFCPMAAAVAEVPVDDRDISFQFRGRTQDYQEVTAQGVMTYRVVDAERVAARIDFGIDLTQGIYVKQPLEQISDLLTGIAQQAALRVIARAELAALLAEEFDAVLSAVEEALASNVTLQQLGIALGHVRLDDLRPSAELERALQTPTREQLQQRADGATFQRRALAVEKERAIAENELQTQVELARREDALIAQKGTNARHEVEQEAEARRLGVVAHAEDQRIQAEAEATRRRIETDAEAARERTVAETQADTLQRVGRARAETTRLEGLAEADKMRAIGEAKAVGERARLDAYRELPPEAVFALAAQELAGQLRIDSLTVTPDNLAGLLEKAAKLGMAKLEGADR